MKDAKGSSGESEPSRTPVSEQPPTETGVAGTAVHTFLIADVRGYTRFTQERGDEEAGRLAAAFAALAREAVGSQGGEVIELRGDEALCVFASARQALRAAVELQRRFRKRTEGVPAFPLPIGIGLDAGESVPIEGGYRGEALNTASRLCALAKRGEILATDTVVRLAHRLEGIRFVERRPVRLKGLEKPVGMVEVVPEAGLPPLPELPETAKKRPLVRRRHLAVMAIAGAGLFTAMVVLVVTRGGEDVLSGLEGNSVGVIDAEAAEIVSQASVGTRPSAIATGGGFVWVASEADGTLSRIDPDLRFVRTLRVGESATGVSYGGGSVWVANGKERTVSQIDPDDLKFVQNFVVGNEPRAVAVGEGAVWVANAIDGTVSRIDLGSGDVEEIPVGSGPAGIAVGTGGVWVTSEASGTVTRLDPRAGTPVQPVGVGNGPTGVAVGEGAVWVANRQDGTVSRIDPATNAVSRTVDVGRNPTAVAAGFGAIWVANAGDGTISRIDASTGEPDETISVASSPNALALEDGRLWTTTLPSLSTHRGGALRIESIPLGCKCIDPAFVGDYVEFQFVYPLAYDGLVAFRRVGGIGGGAVVGNLAVGVPAPTNQGRTYSFQLRPGVLFSDGRPVRASDFRFSLERLLTVNPDLFSSYDRIVGASGCSARPPERCDLSRGIEADDETGRITIHLTEPDPDLLSKLTFPYASVVPADTPLRIVRREPIPSTGAYRIASYSKRELRLDRNPHFRVWSPDARPDGYPDEIRFHLSEDQGAQLAAVERETADFVLLYPAPVESLRGLVTRYPGRLHSDTPPITDFMFLNTRLPPFDDPRVRQAVNLATDRERVAEVLGGTLVARPTCQLLPPTIPGYQPYCPYTRGASGGGTWTSPDPGRATMLVAESGTRGMRVEVATREDRPSPGPYFVSLLRRLGYESSLRVLPAPNSPGPDPDYYEYVQDSRNQAQIGPITWFADAAPALFLDLFSCASFLPESPANGNFSQFCEPEIDAVMERAAEIQPADPVRANALWAEADHALVDQAAAVPLVNQRILGFVSERVGNYQFHPQWGPLFDQMWVK